METMKLKIIPKGDVEKSIEHGCLTPKSGSFLYNLVELCDKIEDDKLFELIPIRLVAYLEDVLREKYALILGQPTFFEHFISQKEVKIDTDNIKQILNSRIPLNVYLAYSFRCNKLKDIFDNILALTKLNLHDYGFKKFHNETWNSVMESIKALFDTRHRLCHESGIGVCITKIKARKWIQDVGILLNLIDEVITESVYEEYLIFKKEGEATCDVETKLNKSIQDAQKQFYETEKDLDQLVSDISNKDNHFMIKSHFEYVAKWKEYRDVKIICENIFPEGSKQYDLFMLREKIQYNILILNEIRIKYRDTINHIRLLSDSID